MIFLIAASWLAVRANGAEYFVKDSGRCTDNGEGEYFLDKEECRMAALSLGIPEVLPAPNPIYTRPVGSKISYGCLYWVDESDPLFYNPYEANTGTCGATLYGMPVNCICRKVGGEAVVPTEKICADIRKPRTCKELSAVCDYNGRKADPRCSSKTPGATLSIKEFCEIIPTRKWCKQNEECFWTGDSCMLKSEATCGHIERKRTCRAMDDCLNGRKCVVTYERFGAARHWRCINQNHC